MELFIEKKEFEKYLTDISVKDFYSKIEQLDLIVKSDKLLIFKNLKSFNFLFFKFRSNLTINSLELSKKFKNR